MQSNDKVACHRLDIMQTHTLNGWVSGKFCYVICNKKAYYQHFKHKIQLKQWNELYFLMFQQSILFVIDHNKDTFDFLLM